MQFPRAQRFRSPPPSTLPGPGAYDVPVASPDRAYKKGAMLEQAKRFVGDGLENKPDTFGLYDPPFGEKENQQPTTARKRVASSAAGLSGQAERERHKQQLEDLRHRLSQQHEKDLAKLQAKIGRLETAREESAKEKAEQANELSTVKSENRHLTSKLTKTEALLAKHQSTLPLLQTKLADLQSSNEQSRQRKEAELSALSAQLTQRTEELEQTREERDEARTEAEREKQAREEQASAAGEAIAAARAETHPQRLGELLAAQTKAVKLERQLADREAQVQSLVAYADGLEARLTVFQDELRGAEEDARKMRSLWREERELAVSERGEKEWRQRARADLREVEGLREEVEGMREMGGLDREAREIAERVDRERRKRWAAEKKEMKREYEVVEGELDYAVNEEIPRLEFSVSTTSATLCETQSLLTCAQADIAELQQRLIDETERLEGELEEQKRVCREKEKEASRERDEKKRVLGLLQQTRASEGALSGEVEALSSELSRLAPLLTQTTSQQQTIDHLARLSSAAEAESAALMAENIELLGHGNQNQRISHVAQLREQLAESRRKHLATTSSLSFAEQRIAALEAELSTYRPAGSSSSSSSLLLPSTTGRSRVSRPQMSDAVSPSSTTLSSSSAPTLTQPRALLAPPPPPVVIVEPSPSPLPAASSTYLSASAAAPCSRTAGTPSSSLSALLFDDPILPPHLTLARSQPSVLPSAAAAAKKTGGGGGAKGKVPAPVKSATVKVKKGRFLGDAAAEEEGSQSVRMEGRMSVSELFA
ncbi:hypothetical protein JCM8547_003653 [Rhodosporidiobolus lusitaniae]